MRARESRANEVGSLAWDGDGRPFFGEVSDIGTDLMGPSKHPGSHRWVSLSQGGAGAFALEFDWKDGVAALVNVCGVEF